MRFSETYEWAQTLDVKGIVAAIQRAAGYPLRSIGSGGSLSAAQFCADWHQHVTGRLAHASTPLEAVALAGSLRGSAVSVFSASGRNRDILRAFASAIAGDPPAAWVVTATANSRLENIAREGSGAAVLGERPPAGRDGFLATNSLLSFCIVTHRAYQAAFGIPSDLPHHWASFAGDAPETEGVDTERLFSANALVVLHGYSTRAAATDLESKCTEAALASVHLADFRNFAHGRHHWLAKRPDTAVLAMAAPEDEALAVKTMAILPRSVSKALLRVGHGGMLGGLRGFVDVMRMVAVAGRVRGIDPGRPGVPSFGSKIYSLRGIDLVRVPGSREKTVASLAVRAIERKVQRPFHSLTSAERETWLSAFAEMRNSLERRAYVAIVFDYDGTLVDSADRFNGPRPDVTVFLTWLLARRVRIGIATGRGSSVGKELRARLPERFWSRVLVGYYNGGAIAQLTNAQAPDRSAVVDDSLSAARDALESSGTVTTLAVVTPRRPQITIEPHDFMRTHEVWDAAVGALVRANVKARMVRSSHSVDVLADGVSKTAIVDALGRIVGRTTPAPVLRIGDRGVWPGNDAEILACTDGISVDEVSSDPHSAWNVAPFGVTGVRATLALRAFLRVSRSGSVRLKIADVARARVSVRRGGS